MFKHVMQMCYAQILTKCSSAVAIWKRLPSSSVSITQCDYVRFKLRILNEIKATEQYICDTMSLLLTHTYKEFITNRFE